MKNWQESKTPFQGKGVDDQRWFEVTDWPLRTYFARWHSAASAAEPMPFRFKQVGKSVSHPCLEIIGKLAAALSVEPAALLKLPSKKTRMR